MLSFILFIAIIGLQNIYRAWKFKSWEEIENKFIPLVLPAALGFIFQLWYNYARWGSITTFVDMTVYQNFLDNPPQLAHLLKIGLFDLSRIISTFKAYFGLILVIFLWNFPGFKCLW
ncbi:MAG: hypothetical protein R3A13_06925 [Bdellovibrionota bacterium]